MTELADELVAAAGHAVQAARVELSERMAQEAEAFRKRGAVVEALWCAVKGEQ